jgi:glutathione S-transferase
VQTHAIVRYLARKHHLYGDNDREAVLYVCKMLDFALSQYWFNSCYPLLIHRSPAIGRSIDMVAELVRDLQLAIRQSGNVNKFLGLLNRQLEKFPGGMLCFASCSRNFPHQFVSRHIWRFLLASCIK